LERLNGVQEVARSSPVTPIATTFIPPSPTPPATLPIFPLLRLVLLSRQPARRAGEAIPWSRSPPGTSYSASVFVRRVGRRPARRPTVPCGFPSRSEGRSGQVSELQRAVPSVPMPGRARLLRSPRSPSPNKRRTPGRENNSGQRQSTRSVALKMQTLAGGALGFYLRLGMSSKEPWPGERG
jgi:hypothetical protein